MQKKKPRETVKFLFHQYLNLLNEHCYTLQSGSLDTFTQVRENVRKKKRERRKRTVERHFCLMFSRWLNIAGILQREEKRKRNCFLNLTIICLIITY